MLGSPGRVEPQEENPTAILLYPFGPILAFFMCVFVTAGQNYTAFLGDHIDWYGVSVAYIGLPVFLATFLYHRIKHRTHMVPLDKVDLSRHE